MTHVGRRFLSLPVMLLSISFWAPTPTIAEGGCDPSPTSLCLQSNQFGVSVDWESLSTTGSGQVIGPNTLDTGFFSYDDGEAAETMVKVLNGCTVNNHYWVFLAQVSSHGQDVVVTDFGSGAVKTYSSSLGMLPTPIIDTEAFACVELAVDTPKPAELGGSDLFLAGGRFRVSVEWTDFGNNTGPGNGISITDRSGAFWFFNSSNLEMLVKMVADTDTGFYGLSLSAISNVGISTRFTDICSGQVATFVQPLGTASAVTDAAAFPIACTAQIFADGFESGDLTGWDHALP